MGILTLTLTCALDLYGSALQESPITVYYTNDCEIQTLRIQKCENFYICEKPQINVNYAN